MRNRRNKKRRLSVQNLETRKLFAADVGFGDMTYGPDAPAEIGSVRPGKVERPVFGPLDNGCPSCDFENQAEASTTTEPTKVERPVFGPHFVTFDNVLPEQITGSADPGGDDIFTEQVGGSAGPGGDDVFTEQVAGSAGPGGDDV